MNSSLLINKVLSIQNEYANLLSDIIPLLRAYQPANALDAINIFWVRHINCIRLFLRSHLANKDCYAYTAATCMDYSKGEHMPLLLLGDTHLLDDPLGKYSEICNRLPNGKAKESFLNQICFSAEKNLELLQCAENHILVLPLRIMNQSSMDDDSMVITDQAFLSLFNGIETMQEYYEKCHSIDDVIKYGIDRLDQLILLSENDDTNESLNDRFKTAISSLDMYFDTETPEATAFYYLVGSYISQALDVIISFSQYHIIPVLPTRISLHYVLLLSKCTGINMIHEQALEKMVIAYKLHDSFDYSRIPLMSIAEYVAKRNEYRFEEVLLSRLKQQEINETNFLYRNISPLINEELASFYDYLTH